MPIKVTLVSPRSRLHVKVSSTVSVNSEFEYLNLPGKKAAAAVSTVERADILDSDKRPETEDSSATLHIPISHDVEPGARTSTHQSRSTEKKSEKSGFLSSIDFTSKSKKKNGMKNCSSPAPQSMKTCPSPAPTSGNSPSPSSQLSHMISLNMSNCSQQTLPSTQALPVQQREKLPTPAPFPIPLLTSSPNASQRRSKSSSPPFSTVVTNLVSSISSPRSSCTSSPYPIPSNNPSPSPFPIQSYRREEEDLMTSPVRKMTELPSAGMTPPATVTVDDSELTPPVRASHMPAPERPPKSTSQAQVPVRRGSYGSFIKDFCSDINNITNTSFFLDLDACIDSFSDDSFWDNSNCETLRISDKPNIINDNFVNEEMLTSTTVKMSGRQILESKQQFGRKDYFDSCSTANSSQVFTSERIINKDYISRSKTATPIQNNGSYVGASSARYTAQESPRVVSKLSCQVSNYPVRESNSTLPDLPSTPPRNKQSPEPQVAQPQRPPRGLQSPAAMQSPPPAYQHQKPTPPKPAAAVIATSLKTGFPPMIINNPSYRSVSPSPNRSPSPVCDSPSPPPPPAPTSSPPPLYEPPTVVPAVVSHTRTRSHSPEPFFPPPPSNGTLKRMTSYRRTEGHTNYPGMQMSAPGIQQSFSGVEDLQDMDQSSPSRNAAKGAAGWQKFHGKNGGRSVSVTLTKEEAELIRQRRREAYRAENNMSVPLEMTCNDVAEPPVQRHKLSYTSGTVISWHNPTYLESPNLKIDLSQTTPTSESNPVNNKLSNSQQPPASSSHKLSAEKPPVAVAGSRVEELTKKFSGNNSTSRLITASPPPVKRSPFKDPELMADRSRKPTVSAKSPSPLIMSPPPNNPSPVANSDDEASPPPLPPKPRQKISKIGSPNADNFIVMDNSSYFATAANTSPNTTSSSSLSTGASLSSSPVGQQQPQRSQQIPLQYDSKSHDSTTPVITRLTEANLLSSPSAVMSLTNVLSTSTAAVKSHSISQLPPEPHSRSDSGLSSLGSWNGCVGGPGSSGARSGSSSVRSSSIVSNSSAKLEELFNSNGHGGGSRSSDKRSSSIVSSCSMKLEEFDELEEDENCAGTDEGLGECEQGYQYQTSIENGVQRQLATVKEQKERLIKEIVENEQIGMDIQKRLESCLTGRDLEKYGVYLEEMEKVVLLLLSLSSRLERAEEELACGNLTDWEKEAIRRKRDKLSHQLEEAHLLRDRSNKRQVKVEDILSRELGDQVLHTFRIYISRREELLRSQRACEEAERSILPAVTTV